jgi:hypothetical protein
MATGPADGKLGYTIKEAVDVSPVSRSEMYLAMRRGDLKAKKHGKRTIILRDDLAAYLAALPDYGVAA